MIVFIAGHFYLRLLSATAFSNTKFLTFGSQKLAMELMEVAWE